MIKKFLNKLSDMFHNETLRKKLLFTLIILAVYRLFVVIPVPFVSIGQLMSQTLDPTTSGGLGFFMMLLGGSLENFSIIAVGLAPFINASIIIQLLTAVVPQLEELSEQGEVGQVKIQQYTRYLTVPLAFMQGIGMVFFINYLLGGSVIDTSLVNLLLSAFAMTVGSVFLMRLGELITEKGIANGISLLIFSSIVAGITQSVYTNVSASTSIVGMISFMLVLVLVLLFLSVLILKSIKEIPIIYSKQGKVQESSRLPIPMNPVGMIPIIFSIAFVSLPYLASRLIVQFQPGNQKLVSMANWIESNLNIYAQQPGVFAILLFFVFIVLFTFFYALIVFSPERISDTIQKRGGFIPGIRPGKETANYINKIIMHLCLWGGMALGLIGIYSYIIPYIPFVRDAVQVLGSLPVVVTGSGIIIIVGVVQDILNKVDNELMMQKYTKL